MVRRIAAVLAVTWVGCGTPAVPATEEEKAPAKKAGDAKTPAPTKPTVTPPVPPERAMPKTLPRAEAIAKATEIHGKRRSSFFCGCSYTPALRTIRQSCGYRTRADESLAHDVVWTHVVPPDVFGAHRPCWTTEACRKDDGKAFGGIECCRQTDPVFAAIEGDLHNLVPVIGEIAKDRSDHAFGDIKGEVRMYGACDVEVDDAAHVIEPPPKIRGDIARIYLYLRAVYGEEIVAPPQQWEMFEAWNAEDPPDAWELERAAAITAVQGVAHPLLVTPAGGAVSPPASADTGEGDVAPPDGRAVDGKAIDAKTKDAKAPAGAAPGADAKAPADESATARRPAPDAPPVVPSKAG